MRFSSYVGLMLCLSLGFYLMGQPSALLYILGCGNSGTAIDSTGSSTYGCSPISITSMINRMGQMITSLPSQGSLIGLGTAAAAAIGTAILVSVSGFSAIYIIPIFILAFIVNFLVVPVSMFLPAVCSPTAAGTISTCTANSLPDIIYMPFLLIFNVITVMAIVSFVRGPS